MDVYTPPTPRADDTHPIAMYVSCSEEPFAYTIVSSTEGPSRRGLPRTLQPIKSPFSPVMTLSVSPSSTDWLLSRCHFRAELVEGVDDSASLRDIRADLCDAYMYIQEHLESDLAQRGYEYTLRKDRCMVTGGSAGGTSSIFLVSLIDREQSLIARRLPT
jgi:hypothetical protein